MKSLTFSLLFCITISGNTSPSSTSLNRSIWQVFAIIVASIIIGCAIGVTVTYLWTRQTSYATSCQGRLHQISLDASLRLLLPTYGHDRHLVQLPLKIGGFYSHCMCHWGCCYVRLDKTDYFCNFRWYQLSFEFCGPNNIVITRTISPSN